MFLTIEIGLHENGYAYVGPCSIYELTWIEIFRIVDANEIRNRSSKGIRKSDLDKFKRFEDKTRKRQ